MSITAPSTYQPREVPVSGIAGRSRFLLGSSPTGISRPPVENVIGCYLSLLAENKDAAASVLPERKTIAIQRVVPAEPNGEGVTHALIDRPPISAVVTVTPVASGKFVKVDGSGGELLDLFFRGERSAFRPEVVFQALLDFATAHNLGGRSCRDVSDAVAQQLALNAGIVVGRHELNI